MIQYSVIIGNYLDRQNRKQFDSSLHEWSNNRWTFDWTNWWQKSVQIRDTEHTHLSGIWIMAVFKQKDTVIQEVQNPIDSLIVTVMPVSCKKASMMARLWYTVRKDKRCAQYSILNKIALDHIIITIDCLREIILSRVKDTFGCVFGDSINLGLAGTNRVGIWGMIRLSLGQPYIYWHTAKYWFYSDWPYLMG